MHMSRRKLEADSIPGRGPSEPRRVVNDDCVPALSVALASLERAAERLSRLARHLSTAEEARLARLLTVFVRLQKETKRCRAYEKLFEDDPP